MKRIAGIILDTPSSHHSVEEALKCAAFHQLKEVKSIDPSAKRNRTWETDFVYPSNVSDTVFNVTRGKIDQELVNSCIVLSKHAPGDIDTVQEVFRVNPDADYYLLVGNEFTGLDPNVLAHAKVSLSLNSERTLSIAATLNIAAWVLTMNE